MSTQQLISWFGLYLGAFVFSFVIGLLPLLSIELFLLAAGTLTHNPWHLLAITLLTALGQLLSKLLLYASGRGALANNLHGRLLGGPGLTRLQRLSDRFTRNPGSTRWLLFVSALIGLPPNYLCSIVCGMFRMNLGIFTLLSGLGFVLRFAGLVYLPQLIRLGMAAFP